MLAPIYDSLFDEIELDVNLFLSLYTFPLTLLPICLMQKRIIVQEYISQNRNIKKDPLYYLFLSGFVTDSELSFRINLTKPLFCIIIKTPMRLLILLNLVLLLQACHYSCFNCTGTYYTSCLSCHNQTALTIVQDPTTLPPVYWSSVYPTGTCVETMQDKANVLGILLFIVLSLVYAIIGTKEAFFLYLSFQTYGLYNLVEIAWVNPIGYVLQAFQHFMIWNVIGSGYKDTDYVLFTNKRHRLDMFLKQSQLAQNLALIAAFTILALLLLIVICIVAVRRKKQAQKDQKQKEAIMVQQLSQQKRFAINEQRSQTKREIQLNQKRQVKEQVKQDQQKPTCWQRFSQKVLANIAKVLLIIIFLMVQETSLVLLVSLVFNNSKPVIVISVIYLHILIFAMSYAYYYRVEYFRQKNVMYACFAKKIIMPILVVVPLKYQQLFILFIVAFLIIQIVIDCYNGFYKKFTRMVLYKGVDLLCTILLLVCFSVEHQQYGYGSTRAASIAAVFVLGFNLGLFFCIQVPMGIKERFFSNQQEQQQQEQDIQNQQQPLPEKTLNQDINALALQTIELVEMYSSDSDRKKDNQQDKKTKDEYNSTVQRSVFEPQQDKNDHNTRIKNPNQQQKPVQKQQPVKKKRRKQIIDKQLRMRYGI